MCGILGIASKDGRPPDAALDAIELLRHRGPDSEGRFASGPVAMAMRRLAIIDLVTGDQPIANEAGDVTCIVNGELYNYLELRDELRARGHVFRTSGDVEVVPHLYEELGERCFERLRGMFAVSLWDERRGRLVLARDPFGIKPLYLGNVEGALAFSSEIKPLLAMGVPARPDPQAVADLLSLGYVPDESTGLADVRALAAGHVLTWEDGVVRETRYATVEPHGGADLEQTLRESVRLHLRSDVPLAVLLSGGLDSSLIAAFAASEEGAGLHTFTVGFGDTAFDELEPARVVAEAIGSEHHEVQVRADAAADLPEIVRALEEPLADPSAIPLWYVCRAAAGEVKVALAGEGGDEVFGGYARYAWDRHAARLAHVLPTRTLARALDVALGGAASRGGRRNIVRRATKLLRNASLPPAERYYAWFALLSDEAKHAIVPAPTAPAARVFADAFAAAPSGLTALGRLQYADLRTMLASDLLLKADRMSMAHSLELRVPLLDTKVVAAGLALTDRAKVRGVETKRALRELVARHVSPEIARRPKRGFEVPIDRWLRDDLRPLAQELLAPDRLARHGLVDPAAVGLLLRRHLDGEARLGLPIYGLMVLELWLEQVVDARPAYAL